MKIKIILLLLMSLLIMSSLVAIPNRFQEIEHKQAKYIDRHSDAWSEGGRVIGEIKHAPEKFTIKFSNAGSGKIVYTYESPARLSIYQTRRLPPGTYDMLIESEGFLEHKILNVKVLARKDCLINLNFGLRVYDNRL